MAHPRTSLTTFERVQERIFKKWMQDLRELAQFIQFPKTLKREKLYDFYQSIILGLTSGESFSTYQYIERHLPGLISANVSLEACLTAFSDLRNQLLNALIRDQQISNRERQQWTAKLLSFFDNLMLFLQKQFYLIDNIEYNAEISAELYPKLELPFTTFTIEGNRFAGKVRFNSRWTEWTGIRLEKDAIWNKWAQVIHPDDWKLFQEEMTLTIRERQTFYQFEYRLKFQDKKWHKVIENGEIFYNGKGKPLFLAGTIFTGTYSKKSTRFLSRLAGVLLKSTSLPGFLMDGEGTLIYANHSFQKLLRKSLSFPSKETVTSLFTPEHARIVQSSIQKLSAGSESEIEEEIYFRSASGKSIDQWFCSGRKIEAERGRFYYFFECRPAEAKKETASIGESVSADFFKKLQLIRETAGKIREEGINAANLKSILKTAVSLSPGVKRGQIFLHSAQGFIPGTAVGCKIREIRKFLFFKPAAMKTPPPKWLEPGIGIFPAEEFRKTIGKEFNRQDYRIIEENLKLSEARGNILAGISVNRRLFALLKLDRPPKSVPVGDDTLSWLSVLLSSVSESLSWIRSSRELRESAKPASAILQMSSLPAAILRKDKIVNFNSKFEELFLSNLPKKRNLTAEVLFTTAEMLEWRKTVEALIAGTNETETFEFRKMISSGSERFFQALIKPVTHKEKPALLLEFIDITRRKELEQQLLQLQRLETVNALSAGMTHDFNNILGAIIPSAEIILTQKTDPIVIRHAKLIFKMSQRASALVTQLLSIARLDDAVRKPVNLTSLVTEIQEMVSRLSGPGVRIHYDLDEKLPAIEGNRNQLLQCVMNLIINARDTMEGDGRLIIRTKTIPRSDYRGTAFAGENPKKIVELLISDTGQGIPEQILPKIFNPLFTTKLPEEGTGLGLSTVKKIIESHRGAITVHSKEGIGTTFELAFPATRRKETRKRLHGTRKLHRGTGKILVIDDEDELLEVLGSMLEIMGYEPLLASTGDAGLSLFRRHHGEIRAVLLDYALPGFSGNEIFNSLKEIDNLAKIIICTGYGESDEIRGLGRLKIDGLLTKPFTLEMIGTLLKEVLSS